MAHKYRQSTKQTSQLIRSPSRRGVVQPHTVTPRIAWVASSLATQRTTVCGPLLIRAKQSSVTLGLYSSRRRVGAVPGPGSGGCGQTGLPRPGTPRGRARARSLGWSDCGGAAWRGGVALKGTPRSWSPPAIQSDQTQQRTRPVEPQPAPSTPAHISGRGLAAWLSGGDVSLNHQKLAGHVPGSCLMTANSGIGRARKDVDLCMRIHTILHYSQRRSALPGIHTGKQGVHRKVAQRDLSEGP